MPTTRNVMNAFEKIQKAEHRLKQAREAWGLQRITWDEYKARSKEITERYALTPQEQYELDIHNKVLEQRAALRKAANERASQAAATADKPKRGRPRKNP